MDDALSTILHSVWTELAAAVRDRRHGLHVGTVATVASDGTPRARSVVLRAVDPADGALRFHTDLRSPKVGEIARRPAIAWHFYAPERALQIRMLGVAYCASTGAEADLAWRESPVTSRRCYLAPAAPGAGADGPSPNLPEAVRNRRPTEGETEPGRDRFAIVRTRVTSIDWLSLASEGHRRAEFHSDRDAAVPSWTGRWIEP